MEQEGPVRLEGEGTRVALSWEAPLALRAWYEGAWHLAAKGEGEAEGVAFRVDLTWGPEGYRGGFGGRGTGLS